MSETAPSNRKFGFVFTVFFAVLAVLFRRKHPEWVLGTAILSGVTLLVALAIPSLLTPFNRAWMKLAEVLHRITSPIILGVLFFVLFTPVALFMKFIKRDTMTRRFDPNLSSYWNVRTPPGPPPASLADQF